MSAIVIADAIANVEPAGPTASLVSRWTIAQGQKQINLPLWGRLTAAALSEGTTMNAPQQVSVTVRNLTASEHGVLTFASDRLTRQNNEAVLSQVGMMQGLAVGRLRESDLVTLFDSVTGLSNPGTTNIFGFRQLAGHVSYLRTDNNASFGPAPAGRTSAVLHPEHIRRLVEDDSGLQAGTATGTASTATMASGARQSGPSEDVIKNYWRGNVTRFGVDLWESGVIPLSGTDAKGSVFVEHAFALAMALEIEAEDDRDIRSRGTDMVTVAEWGESEVVDDWATEVFATAAPLS
jgi:hypothetical protein